MKRRKKTTCDRNGCSQEATVLVKMGYSLALPACKWHGEWYRKTTIGTKLVAI